METGQWRYGQADDDQAWPGGSPPADPRTPGGPPAGAPEADAEPAAAPDLWVDDPSNAWGSPPSWEASSPAPTSGRQRHRSAPDPEPEPAGWDGPATAAWAQPPYPAFTGPEPTPTRREPGHPPGPTYPASPYPEPPYSPPGPYPSAAPHVPPASYAPPEPYPAGPQHTAPALHPPYPAAGPVPQFSRYPPDVAPPVRPVSANPAGSAPGATSGHAGPDSHASPAGHDEWTRAPASPRYPVIEDDRIRPSRRGEYGDEPAYLPALGYTAGWYAVPAVLHLIWLLTIDGERQASAWRTFLTSLPWLFGALVLSLAIAGLLRWAIAEWRAMTISFAAAVIGAGVTTIIYSLAG